MIEGLTAQEKQAFQIKHCMNRLKERFDLGPEHYYQILNRIANGGGTMVKPSKTVKDTYVVRLNYLGNRLKVVVDSKHSHMLTVYK
ncbi:Uncharacterised protein [uncultured archaeon]|nr:Uncharacterised protein [uncultured archaeon]